MPSTKLPSDNCGRAIAQKYAHRSREDPWRQQALFLCQSASIKSKKAQVRNTLAQCGMSGAIHGRASLNLRHVKRVFEAIYVGAIDLTLDLYLFYIYFALS